MQNESITLRQAIFIMIMFIAGSSVVMGVNTDMKQDSWISLLLAIAMALPVITIYARIIKLFPEKDIYDITVELFGNIVGKIIIVLLTWYAIHLGALVLRNFSEFIKSVSLQETPQLPLMISMILVALYLAKSGMETLGKWGVIVFSILITVLFFTIVFSLKDMDFTNIMPIMGNGFGKIAVSSFRGFAFPFAETILFLALSSSIKKDVSPYKMYIYAVLLGGLVLLLVVIRNILSLGPEMMEADYYPSFAAARIIHIGDFLTRIEGSISVNFILSGVTKITICIIVATKGIAKLFGLKNHKNILLPVSLLVLALGSIVYNSAMEMFGFLKYYQFYAIPFQLIIPLIIWITAEIKAMNKKPSQA